MPIIRVMPAWYASALHWIIALPMLALCLTASPAWSEVAVTPANKAAAGKRIISTPKTEVALGFKPYPGAMLALNDSIDDCADGRNDRTTFIYTTADPLSKVRAFYGIAARDNNRLGRAEDGRTLQISGDESATRITIRHFPPKASKK